MISARHIGPNAFILTIVDSEAQESIFVKDLTFLKTDVVKIGGRRYFLRALFLPCSSTNH